MNYSEKIDDLIPEANKIALAQEKKHGKTYKTAMGVDGRPMKWHYYTQYFHEAMNKMAFERGIRPWK